jgi:hypothetical protein
MQLSKSSQLLEKGIGRYCVVLFFLGFGLVKFTVGEAAAILRATVSRHWQLRHRRLPVGHLELPRHHAGVWIPLSAPSSSRT